MSYYENCACPAKRAAKDPRSAKEGLKRPGGGSKLLLFVLNFLMKVKKAYNIKRIVLQDNSFIECDCDESLSLDKLRMITKGQPWYMKYGFKPYNSRAEKPAIEHLKEIEYNNKILQNMKTKDIINKIMKHMDQKDIKKIDMKIINKIAENTPLFRDFIIKLLRNYENCCTIVYILNFVYKPGMTGLFNLYGKTYYLDI